jgi:hypothetical protein
MVSGKNLTKRQAALIGGDHNPKKRKECEEERIEITAS